MYSVPIDRSHPGAILLLIDQSGSMDEPYGGAGEDSKDVVLARAVNRLIRNLVLQCQRGSEIRDYYEVGIIGYSSHGVGSVWGGELAGQQLVPISVVANYPLRLEEEVMPSAPDLKMERPVWVDPVAYGGTPMNTAVDLAGSVMVKWANEHPGSFPPIVVNVSDGEASDADPRPLATQLRSVHTQDGNLLLFNVHISSSSDVSVEFPSTPAGLPDKFSTTLFEMSSELTPYMLAVAQNMGYSLVAGARGFMFNADATRLSEFLDVGTRVSISGDR